MVRYVLVVGGGSTAFLAAVTLKARHPQLSVTVVRNRDTDTVGVLEGTTLALPHHLHTYLGLDINVFYRSVAPSWKLGTRFHWGPRPYFDHTFSNQLDVLYQGMNKLVAFHAWDEARWDDVGVVSALMSQNAAFTRGPDGRPNLRDDLAYHLPTRLFTEYLETVSRSIGIVVQDDVIVDAERTQAGLQGVRLSSGTVTADLYVDCSGSRSALLGEALNQPFRDFRPGLSCDSMVMGVAERTDAELIRPYTAIDTMDAGWSWRLDHEKVIDRGYVYASPFISDAEAELEFRRKNLAIRETRTVKFSQGRYERAWVGNVVALGDASGFVEPLQATRLATVCAQVQLLADSLTESAGEIRPALVDQFNRRNARVWDSLRQFLAVHFKFNTRLDTPFWREYREKTDLGPAADIVAYYKEMGPGVLYRHTLIDAHDPAWTEGYLSVLVGQKVPYDDRRKPPAEDRARWEQIKQTLRRVTTNPIGMFDAIYRSRGLEWNWPQDLYRQTRERV